MYGCFTVVFFGSVGSTWLVASDRMHPIAPHHSSGGRCRRMHPGMCRARFGGGCLCPPVLLHARLDHPPTGASTYDGDAAPQTAHSWGNSRRSVLSTTLDGGTAVNRKYVCSGALGPSAIPDPGCGIDTEPTAVRLRGGGGLLFPFAVQGDRFPGLGSPCAHPMLLVRLAAPG